MLFWVWKASFVVLSQSSLIQFSLFSCCVLLSRVSHFVSQVPEPHSQGVYFSSYILTVFDLLSQVVLFINPFYFLSSIPDGSYLSIVWKFSLSSQSLASANLKLSTSFNLAIHLFVFKLSVQGTFDISWLFCKDFFHISQISVHLSYELVFYLLLSFYSIEHSNNAVICTLLDAPVKGDAFLLIYLNVQYLVQVKNAMNSVRQEGRNAIKITKHISVYSWNAWFEMVGVFSVKLYFKHCNGFHRIALFME